MTRATARTPAARRAIFLALIGVATVAIATPLVRRVLGLIEGQRRMHATAAHDALARRGMFAGDEQVAPVWLNAYCVVDDRPAYRDYCHREYGAAATSFCNVRFCRFGDITTTLDGFTGPLEQIALQPKPAGLYRILALGGSTTGSARWDALWPGALEIELARRARDAGLATRFQVLNDGLVASSSQESRRRYEFHARPYQPDLVILGEEVNDTCRAFQETRTGDGRSQNDVTRDFLAGDASAEELASLSPWFARHVDHFVAWRDALAAGERRPVLAEERRAGSGAVGTDRCRRGPDDPPFEEPSIFDDYTDGIRYTLEEYERVLAIARADGAQVVVTTAPHDFHDWLCPLPYACPPVLSGHDWYRYLTRVANPAVRAFAREHDLVLVDLERAMDERLDDPAERASLFTGEWMHPAPAGHAWIAREYARALWPLTTRPGHGVAGSGEG